MKSPVHLNSRGTNGLMTCSLHAALFGVSTLLLSKGMKSFAVHLAAAVLRELRQVRQAEREGKLGSVQRHEVSETVPGLVEATTGLRAKIWTEKRWKRRHDHALPLCRQMLLPGGISTGPAERD